MKARSLALVVLFAVVALTFGADPLNEALQKGLLEEEANHNLDAAIQAYQSAVSQYDTQRQVAATALFRIAECYRKQAKTNEAAAFYQRVVRDFSDQTKLAELSRPHVPKPVHTVAGPQKRKSRTELQVLAEEFQRQTEEPRRRMDQARKEAERLGEEIATAQRETVNVQLTLASVRQSETPEALAVDIPDEQYRIPKSLYETHVVLKGGAPQTDEERKVEGERLRQQMRAWLTLVYVPRQLAIMDLTDKKVDRLLQRRDQAEVLVREVQLHIRDQLAKLQTQHELTPDEARMVETGKIEGRFDLLDFPQPATGAQSDIGMPAQTASVGQPDLVRLLELERRKAEADYEAVATRLAEYRKLGGNELRQVLLTSSGDVLLTSLTDTLLRTEQKVAQLFPVLGADHPDLRQHVEAVNKVREQIKERVQGYLTGLDTQAKALKARADRLEKDVVSARRREIVESPAPPEPSAATEEEAKEIQRIKALVRSSPDLINAKDGSGDAPLHKAAVSGQLAVAGFLLANGAEVNSPGNRGESPSHRAAQGGHKAMIELLLASGASVNAADRQGETPLHEAAARGFHAVAQVLLDNGAEVNARDSDSLTPLHRASWSGHLPVVQMLIVRGGDVNARLNRPKSQHRFDQEVLLDDDTPLHLAIRHGHQSAAESLLAHGADLKPGPRGESPLASAVVGERLAIAALILQRQQDSGIKDASLDSLLHWSLQPGGQYPGYPPSGYPKPPLVEMAKVLFAHGADVNAEDPAGDPALMKAVRLRNLELVRLLLEKKAAVNAQTADGETALHYVAAVGSKEMVELLLAHGADVSIMNKSGQTPLALAVGRRQRNALPSVPVVLRQPSPPTSPPDTRLEIVDLLRKHGAKE
ncbi:MAG: ankyrin repeat domain-containing protein [Verrucomicrobia bacterium]|nr:ankyrin repeat domain-containing protein [Verrucomicrobiota bacterium]